MIYLLDANVLIEAKNRHYAFDIVPAFWDWLSREHQAGNVFTVQKVAEEILDGDDELSEWLRAQPSSFRLVPQPEDQASLRAVSTWANETDYAPAARSEFLQAGDYFLVAQAHRRGFTVVTQEKPAPLARKRIKIPDACNAMGVAWMSPFEMLKTEHAQFKL